MQAQNLLDKRKGTTAAERVNRRWLAAYLLQRNQTVMPRLANFYRRIQTLSRQKRRALWRRSAAALIGAAFLLAFSHPPALHAAAINVDDGQVAYADDGFCSLAEAIVSANNDAAPFASPGECENGSSADTIFLPANSTFTLTAPFVVNYATGLPDIDSEITIEGNGSTVERDPDDVDNFRLLDVSVSGNLTINHLILQGGSYSGDGGAIENSGTLNINNSTVRENTGGFGGGVYNSGILNISDSTFSDNASACCGGAINNGFGNITIENSTIRNNSASYAGGIENDGELTIINSTISANTTGGEGGGVYNDQGNLTVTNSTITDNTSGVFGGGVVQASEETTIFNRSLISGNHAPVAREAYRLDGTVTADNFNLFGYNNDAGVGGFAPGATDIVPGAGVLVADILETTLADNGGPTETHALVSGSPAIDQAPNGSCTAAPVNGVDQRGEPRNLNGDGIASANECDIGAFEYGTNQAPVCTLAAPSVTTLWPPNHRFSPITILGVSDPDGDPFTIVIDSIFQDEAVNAANSGTTAPDGQGVGTATAQVRRERVETGNGRVYHLTFTAEDSNGESCTATVLVQAPVTRSGTAVDDGPLFDSTVVP